MRNKIFSGLLFLSTAAVIIASVLIAVIMYQGSMTTMQRDLRQEATFIKMGLEQSGKSIRLFIVDCTPWGEDHPELADYRRAFINPEIYEVSEETKLYEEGCLSLPGLHESVRRSLAIRMRYLDENFEPHDEEFTGLPAWVIQHEYDHLEGVVFTDRLSPLRRNLIKSKLMSLTKGRYKCSYKTK